MIAKVQAELHRRDSTDILLEEYVNSLHKADHIEENIVPDKIDNNLL